MEFTKARLIVIATIAASGCAGGFIAAWLAILVCGA